MIYSICKRTISLPVFVFVPQNKNYCRISCVLWLFADNGSWPIPQALIRRCLRGGKCEVSYVISFKKQIVQTIVLVNMKICVKLRSKMFGRCIGRNELILGILTCVEWLWNREIRCFNICVGKGESHTYAVNQNLRRQGRRTLALKKWNVGGVVILESCGFHQKSR